jgi:hypothetical protein
MVARLRHALPFLSLIFATHPAPAQDDYVDLELVLAVDVSRSMDAEEQRLQRDGYASAFRHPEVVAAIASGPIGRIAVTYVEWAGPEIQTVLVPWTILANPEDAFAFADRIGAAKVLRERGTSISGGLEFSAGLFATSGVSGLRRTIDVSGDGPNNMGPPVAQMRDQVVAAGITINGLPILLRPGGGYGAFNIDNLDVYYEDCVIGGPGAFIVTVDDVAEFPAAIRRKLVLEIAGHYPEAKLIPVAVAPRTDCLIGEKRRQRYLMDQY